MKALFKEHLAIDDTRHISLGVHHVALGVGGKVATQIRLARLESFRVDDEHVSPSSFAEYTPILESMNGGGHQGVAPDGLLDGDGFGYPVREKPGGLVGSRKRREMGTSVAGPRHHEGVLDACLDHVSDELLGHFIGAGAPLGL